MYRVVTKHLDRFGKWVVEPGPWHMSRENAENWASILHDLGYQTEVESQHGALSTTSDDQELRKAISSMA